MENNAKSVIKSPGNSSYMVSIFIFSFLPIYILYQLVHILTSCTSTAFNPGILEVCPSRNNKNNCSGFRQPIQNNVFLD